MMSPVTVANTHVEPIRKHMWSRFWKHVNFKTFVLIFIFSAFALRSIFVKPSQGMQATVSSHGPHFASMTHINERHDFGWFYTPMNKVVHQLGSPLRCWARRVCTVQSLDFETVDGIEKILLDACTAQRWAWAPWYSWNARSKFWATKSPS